MKRFFRFRLVRDGAVDEESYISARTREAVIEFYREEVADYKRCRVQEEIMGGMVWVDVTDDFWEIGEDTRRYRLSHVDDGPISELNSDNVGDFDKVDMFFRAEVENNGLNPLNYKIELLLKNGHWFDMTRAMTSFLEYQEVWKRFNADVSDSECEITTND